MFYLILMTVSIFIIKYSITNTYLTAKNDMMERDVKYINQLALNDESFAWYLDYWHNHPKETAEEITNEEIALAYDAPINGLVETSVTEALNSLSPDVQLAVAKDAYHRVKTVLQSELEEKEYGCLFILGISEETRGTVYIQQNSSSGITAHKLGEKWSADLNDEEFARNFTSGSYDTVEFGVSSDEEFNDQKYYIGALPLVNNGEVVAALCIGYNWDSLL
ncbi:MAG: hypothetical protein IKP47_02210 [Ruminococcus sp.]|nr:hypothetical protein [Ruminococcus sp.]